MNEKNTVEEVTAAIQRAANRPARGKKVAPITEEQKMDTQNSTIVEQPFTEVTAPVEQPPATPPPTAPPTPPTPPATRVMKNEERHLKYKEARAVKLAVPPAANVSWAFKKFGESTPLATQPELDMLARALITVAQAHPEIAIGPGTGKDGSAADDGLLQAALLLLRTPALTLVITEQPATPPTTPPAE
jgi:cell pole-organizing protein PopZ